MVDHDVTSRTLNYVYMFMFIKNYLVNYLVILVIEFIFL